MAIVVGRKEKPPTDALLYLSLLKGHHCSLGATKKVVHLPPLISSFLLLLTLRSPNSCLAWSLHED